MRNSQATAELALMHHYTGPAPVDAAVVAGFGDDEAAAVKAAIRWAWKHRRVQEMSQRSAAEHCGIKSQHWSLILKGTKYLPLPALNQFECVMGNTAVSQTIERFRRLRQSAIDERVAQAVVQRLGRAA